MSFLDRVKKLPRLGVGVSTEYQARQKPGALDPAQLRRTHPRYAAFLEVGVEAVRGIDDDARAWASRKWPTTYHYLDINLDEPEDFDAAWLGRVRAIVQELRPAWMCGDAGLWHFGPRERGHMLLLPPVLTADAVTPLAEGIVRLREATKLEVLPENPPGHAFLGDLHLLEFFARLAEAADTGLLLDCAHLAIFQKLRGLDALAGFDDFPFERVVELHVAGATKRVHEGLELYEDSHTPEPAPETWAIFEHIAARAKNLKAVVFECEKNTAEECTPGFERIVRTWGAA